MEALRQEIPMKEVEERQVIKVGRETLTALSMPRLSFGERGWERETPTALSVPRRKESVDGRERGGRGWERERRAWLGGRARDGFFSIVEL